VSYGRPGTKAALLREAVHKRLLIHVQTPDGIPTSNRFVLYEVRQSSGPLYGHRSRSRGRSEDQNVSDASLWLREQGIVPYGWIVDETRSLTVYLYASSVTEYLVDAVAHARIDIWAGGPPPLLLCESRTFGGVLDRTVAPDYLCPVAATNGQAGGFLHTEIAPILWGGDRPVLYVGDLDLRGHRIEANTRKVLEHEVGPLDWQRVALTEEQVHANELPVVRKPDKVLGEHDAVEVEALGQGRVLGLVRAALDELLPEALDAVQVRQEEQRREALARLNGGRS
jgi:hypothetical protein